MERCTLCKTIASFKEGEGTICRPCNSRASKVSKGLMTEEESDNELIEIINDNREKFGDV